MDSFFDEVDDELLQIFPLISSPATAAPFFSPPLSPPNATSHPTPEQIFSQVSSQVTAAPFFHHPLSPPNATSDPTPEQLFSQVFSLVTAAPFFHPPLSPPNATSNLTPEQFFSQVSSPVTAAAFFHPPLSPPNATSNLTPEQFLSQVSSPVTAASFFQPPFSPPNATSDLTPEQFFSQVSSPVTAAPFFFHPPLSPSFQPPLSLPRTTSDPIQEQIFSFVSSPVTAVPFFQPPSTSPYRTSDPTPMAVDNPQRKPRASKKPNEDNPQRKPRATKKPNEDNPQRKPRATKKPYEDNPQRKPRATKKPNEKENRKIIHRDVERQRRQEMSYLYSSIRSLLPQEYLKGKRSVSDHLNEAVNYIKYMQTKRKELNDERDALKRLSKSSTQNQDLVMGRPSWTGGRVVLYTAIANNCLPLSTLIRVLEEDGVHIISYFSSIANHRSIYTMECEADGKRDRDWSELQIRLTNLAHLSRNEMSSADVR